MASTDIREDNRRLVRRFLAALEQKDIDGFLELWHDDAVQEMPFAPPGFPDRLEGKAAIAQQYGGLPDSMSRLRFPIDNLQTLEGPEWVLAEFRGDIELLAGGKYDNRYVCLFHIVDGRVRLYREYFDPIVLARAFGATDALAETFSLEGNG